MNPLSPLKWSSFAFAVLWTGWMIWWSGSYDAANIVILCICGALVGYFWYLAMRRVFQRRETLPR